MSIIPWIDLRPRCEFKRWPGGYCRNPARTEWEGLPVCGVHYRTLILRRAKGVV